MCFASDIKFSTAEVTKILLACQKWIWRLLKSRTGQLFKKFVLILKKLTLEMLGEYPNPIELNIS